jgi:hypothetical protein
MKFELKWTIRILEHFAVFFQKFSNKFITDLRFSRRWLWRMLSSGMWRRVGLCVNRRFGGTYRLHLQGRKIRVQGTNVILYRLWPATTDPNPLLSVDFPCGPLSHPSFSYIPVCFQLVAQSAATCSRWFLCRSLFYPEDGGDTLLRNVGSHKIYTVPHPRRRHSSNL